MSTSQQYAVHGMTCDHCVIAVTEEIYALSVSYTHLTLPTTPYV